jgi:CheY-like chemotaxis protein
VTSAKHYVLVLDDEPELLEWLAEYLEAKGLLVEFAKNITDGIEALDSKEFRFLVLDLNVPIPGQYKSVLADKGDMFSMYPGLYVAQAARNKGYRDRQVIVYSVHDIAEVRIITDRISVTYTTKGRPRAFKAEIDNLLSYDPSVTVGPTNRCR